ncbi:hypothetical protein PAXINDRAFT_10096 [Paxillus involutus ATCC 200175]|nr:hypothetical protein PAXINDRAFT_10096 [Paxillus involutus ATCC 200175]
MPTPALSVLVEDTPSDVVEEPQPGSRIAEKIMHIRNLVATLAPVPATTETDQYSIFNLVRASVETLWSDRRESDGYEVDTPPRRLAVHIDPSTFRRSLEFTPTPGRTHRRAGSSRT